MKKKASDLQPGDRVMMKVPIFRTHMADEIVYEPVTIRSVREVEMACIGPDNEADTFDEFTIEIDLEEFHGVRHALSKPDYEFELAE